jgi:hypothetical protein
MTLENNEHFASNSKANAALTTGVIGTAGFGLNLLGNLLGGNAWNGNAWNGNCAPRIMAPEDKLIDRYTLELEQKLQDAKTQIALRDSTIYTDNKSLDLYKYVDGRFREFEQAIAAQAVNNQATKDSFQLLNERLCCEEKARKCADNSIVNYVNATFYPKMVADVTTGTTTTAQTVYNPLPVDTCCC